MDWLTLASRYGTDEAKVILLLGGGAFLGLAFGFNNIRRVRLIRDTAVSRVASAPQGHVELEGFAWPDNDASMALDQTACVYYRLELQKYVKRGKNHTWETVWRHSGGPQSFLLCDDTGACRVRPAHFNVTCDERTVRWGSLTAIEREVLKNLVPSGVAPGFPPGSGFLGALFSAFESFRVVEGKISVGSFIYAMGKFTSNEAGPVPVHDEKLDGFIAYLREYRKNPRRFLGVLDGNRDGKIAPEEFRKGFAMAGRRAFLKTADALAAERAQPAAASQLPYEVHGSLVKGESKGEVSTLGQEALLSGLQWKAWGALFIGALALWGLLKMTKVIP